MKIDIEGADELVRSIRNRLGADRVVPVIRRNTSQAQAKAMRFAAVDTGFMKRSVTMRVEAMSLAGYITAGAEYSPYVEYGTRYNDSQPFMRPAAREQGPIFLSDMKNLIRKG